MHHRLRLNRADQKLLALALWVVLLGSLSLCLMSLPPGGNSSRVLGQTTLAKLLLSPTVINVNAGGSFSMNYALNTDVAQVYGVDLVTSYDESRLLATSLTPNTATSLKAFAPVVDAAAANYTFDLSKALQGVNRLEFGVVCFNYATATPTTPFTGTINPLATVRFTAQPVRSNTAVPLNLLAADGVTTDSNIIDTDLDDVLGADDVNLANVYIKASDLCRSAISLNDATVGLNDLLFISSKFNQACSPCGLGTPFGTSCPEDINADCTIGLGDLLFITSFWGQTCTAP